MRRNSSWAASIPIQHRSKNGLCWLAWMIGGKQQCGAEIAGFHLGNSAFTFLLCHKLSAWPSADYFTVSELWCGAKKSQGTSFLLSFAYSWTVRSLWFMGLYLFFVTCWCSPEPGRAPVLAAATLPGCTVSNDTNPTGRLYMKALISFTKISPGAIIAAVKCWQFLSMGHLLKYLMGVKNTWTNC